jgi:hypothetical protein
MAKETVEFSMGDNASSVSAQGDDVEVRATTGIEFDSTDPRPKEEDENVSTQADADADAAGEGDDAEGDNEEPGSEEEGDEGGELPDTFDPEDPEVVAAFDAKYTLESGELDTEGALTAEYWANVEAGKDGLNDATYEYLASKGISKATVKQVEAMAQTQKDAEQASVKSQDFKLFEIAGGADKLQAALKWGKEGGYTEAQQKRFNEITKGKDLEAKEEAVEALMARYRKANPTPKPKVPARDATKGQATKAAAVKPFASREEMRKVRDSIAEGDKAAWAAYNRRRSVTKFD